MHYTSVPMQGPHFDTSGYQAGLYGTSPTYDGSSIKLHHAHYPETSDNFYNGYLNTSNASPNCLPKEPPSYAESTLFYTGFVQNPGTPYYRVPSGRPHDMTDYASIRNNDSMIVKSDTIDINQQSHHQQQQHQQQQQQQRVDISHSYGNEQSRLLTEIDTSGQTEDPRHSVKLETEAADYKNELAIRDGVSPNESEDCLSNAEDVKEEETSDKTEDGAVKGQSDGSGGDKSQGNSDIKPALSYIALIAKAILESPQKRLSLGSIYSWIEKNYPYYQNRGQGWRNSVRHNLSLNDCFIKAGRCEDGKGNYWAIHPANVQDFMRGDFRQRRRSRRRGRKKDCDYGMYMSNGWAGSPLGPSVSFNPAAALSSIYSPYTEAERRAYRLDDALLRQSMNNPFMKWYHANGSYSNQNSPCSVGMYGNSSPQWQAGYTDQGSQAVYPLNSFSPRNYTTPALV